MFNSFYVHQGTAAINVGYGRNPQLWVGYAEGNESLHIRRRTPEKALEDAKWILQRRKKRRDA